MSNIACIVSVIALILDVSNGYLHHGYLHQHLSKGYVTHPTL